MLKFLKNLSPFSKKIALGVIFLEYDRPDHGGSNAIFAKLQKYLAKITDCHISYLRVDNKNEETHLQRHSSKVYSIGGDNRYREFSGWQKGFENFPTQQGQPDLILFVNDMFLAPGESFLKDYASKELLEKSLSEQSIIGRIDSTGQRYRVYDYDVSSWICTNCFLAPRKAIESIGNIVSVQENLDDFLPSTCPITQDKHYSLDLFKGNAPINDTYKLWLVEWLTKRWHSRFEINNETWELFRTKVRNILNESILTARFTEAGFPPQTYGDKMYY